MNYTLAYNYDSNIQCGKIHFNDKYILVDFDDLFSIINMTKTFIYHTPDKTYPYYMRNEQKITYRDYLFEYDNSNIEYVFKNGNQFDLRRSNVTFFHKYHNIIKKQYNILSYQHGHITKNGKDAYTMKNPIWKIKENENENEYILMYCEKNTICKLCPKSYQKILNFEKEQNNGNKLTFYKHSNGYIYCSKNLSIHQIITGYHGNGKGTKNLSVDHIDQDPLNNTFDNLRIATREEQEQNSKGIKEGTKRARKKSAKLLPDGITQDMLKKYVTYEHEYCGKKNTKREFFRVNDHPKLDKQASSSKSEKFTIREKLDQANKIVEDLENDIYPESKKTLPTYYSQITARGKPHLVYERRREGGIRENVKMVLPEDYDLEEQLERMTEKVNKKYGEKES